MKATGTYITSSTAGESIKAFLPNSLPPEPPIELTGRDHDLIEKANRALGRLDGVTTLLPDVSLFLYSYVRITYRTSTSGSTCLRFRTERTWARTRAMMAHTQHPTAFSRLVNIGMSIPPS